MQSEIIVAIIGAVGVVAAAIISVIAARRRKGSNGSGKVENYSQTAIGNNNSQFQINK